MNEDDSAPAALALPPMGYVEWLGELKARIRAAQLRASLAANSELLMLYWGIGRDILERQSRLGWGAKVIERLAIDLRAAFPEMKGFSRASLLHMRAFSEAWPDPTIVQQAVGQLPWGHNLVLLAKVKSPDARLLYARLALEHNWSRSILVHQIETRAHERFGKAVTNFTAQLPAPHSDLARESLKDPYRFDFLSLGAEALERDIESALIVVAPYYGTARTADRSGWPEAFLTRMRNCQYRQFLLDILPTASGAESVLRLDHLQPVGKHHDSYSPTKYRLSEEALELVDEWLEWLVTGDLGTDGLLAYFRPQIAAGNSTTAVT